MKRSLFSLDYEKKEGSRWKMLFFLFLLSVLIEVFVFQFRTLQSMFYREIPYPTEKIEVENAENIGDGCFVLCGEEGKGQLYLTGLNEMLQGKKLRNIRLELELPEAQERPDRESGVAKVRIYVRDGGHDRYAVLEEQVLHPEVEDSCYFWMDPYGGVKTLVLETVLSEGTCLKIRSVCLNARRPYAFSIVRVLCVFLFLAGLYGMRGKSGLWSMGRFEKVRLEPVYAVALGILLLLPAWQLNKQNAYVWADMHFRPYQDLAEALAWGQLHLRAEPSEALKELANPYDYTAREAAGLEADVDYMWDTAYYQGRYYVYFGVVPCVLFYLPYLLATGLQLPDVTVIFLLACFLYAGIYLLCRIVLKEGDSRPPYAFVLLAAATVFWGSCITGCLASPDAHDVPRICGLVFVIWGLYFWKKSMLQNTVPERKTAALGSLCMALAVGCRPNQLLYSFMAIPVFLPFLKSFRLCDRKQRDQTFAALLLPYLPVAVLLMLYNAARFGSVFDFGYDYNLTVLDYTQKNLFLDRIVVGLYEYLFRIPRMSYRFPFLEKGSFAQGNAFGHGSFYYTWCYGGLLICNLILWCVPSGLRFRSISGTGSRIREKLFRGWNPFSLSLLLISCAELLINISVAGVAWHYLTDFAALLLLTGWIGAAALWQKMEYTPGKDLFRKFLLLGTVWSLVYHNCFYLISNLQLGNTKAYYRLFSMFHFF